MESTQLESRRYAKRQLTWFRSDPSILWLDGTETEEQLQNQARQMVENFIVEVQRC